MRTKSKKIPEQPPANLEEVKRRFIRQNRELAKANSTQSLRIRSLENDNTRLLDEILRLRERNLWLERDRQNAQVSASGEAIRKIKDELQAKFAELSGFVEGLATAENDAPDEDYLLSRERLLSPSQRQYRERQPLAELMQECIMPTISEDKTFPRRTLDADDIRTIRLSDHSSDGSPGLAPLPIAHFDYCTDAQPEPLSTEEDIASVETPIVEIENEALPANLSVNLESRRKKREGQSRLEIRRHSILPQTSENSGNEGSSQLLRTGAKRKLADRDSEKPIKPPSSREFTFSRKPTGANRLVSDGEMSQEQNNSPSNLMPLEETAQEPTKPARKVLGHKSTNHSPQKAQAKFSQSEKDVTEKVAPPKISISRQRAQPRSRRISSVPPSSISDKFPTTVDDLPDIKSAPDSAVELPPKTPAATELFSPAISEDSAQPPIERGDTPPPADLSSMSNTTEMGPRPSRRVRSAVNYAEPSLVSKMRRPNKEMVDAISGIQDSRRSISVPNSRKSQGVTPSSQPTSIKKNSSETEEALSWQDIPVVPNDQSHGLDPGSPLHSRTTKHAAETVVSNIGEPQTKSDAPIEVTDSASSASSAPAERSGSSAAISTLISSSRHRRGSTAGRPNANTSDVGLQSHGDADEAAKRIEEMNLYEFKESSSPASEKLVDNRKKTEAPVTSSTTARSASQRRHSSITKDVPVNVTSTGGVGTRGERAASRRRSTFV